MATQTSRRDPERGAALAITMIAVTALLGLGAVTLLSVQAEIGAGGQSRFNQEALYAAESGANAAMEFLRSNCSASTMFSQWMSPNNATPQSPSGIIGNGAGSAVFDMTYGSLSYDVTILNNPEDHGFATGQDLDGVVILHSIGHGPDGTTAVIELEVQNVGCQAQFCDQEYAQRSVDSMNDAYAFCSTRVTNSTLRTITPGSP